MSGPGYTDDERKAAFETAAGRLGASFNLFNTWNHPLLVDSFSHEFTLHAQTKGITDLEMEWAHLAMGARLRSKYVACFHATFTMQKGGSKEDVMAVRDGGLPSDANARRIVRATQLIAARNGQLTADDRKLLASLGVSNDAIYDLAMVVAFTTSVSIINAINEPELDEIASAGAEGWLE